MVTDTSPIDNFGIFTLKEHLRRHAPAFADSTVKLVSRNSKKVPAINKLDHVLQAEEFAEIWFFGIHQKNKPKYTPDFPKGGGPESELNQSEVDLLVELMKSDGNNPGIGVLMAGDHANPPPDVVLPRSSDLFCPSGLDHQTFLGLGRAIGHKVPRAGSLRNWEGPPTHCPEDSFNTQVFSRGGDPYGTIFQADPIPQFLDLKRFDPDGTPNPQGQPHPLFTDRDGRPIQVFPDHMHEGEVIIPHALDPAVWPAGAHVQPVPRLLAQGTDKRNGRQLNIVAAYDGDVVQRGRVVADSSWHHYFNVNLNDFPPDSPAGSYGDQIGQFYGNLLVWLAPLSIRREMARVMLTWVATHPLMMEEAGSGPLNIGSTAYRILLNVASPSEVNELLAAVCPVDIRKQFESLNWLDRSISGRFPSKQILLGAILEAHYYFVTQSDDEYPTTQAINMDVINSGFDRAFSLAQKNPVRSSFIEKLTQPAKTPREKFEVGSVTERETIMSNLNSEAWDITLVLDKDPGQFERFGLVLDLQNCQMLGPVTRCDLSGYLEDTAHNRFPLSGRRWSTDRLANFTFEFNLRGLNIVFSAFQQSASFAGKFIALARQHAKAANGFNPDEGDTGTATGSQTLIAADRGA